MSVALVASVPYAGHRLYEQRLASALARHTPVAYLEPPTAPRQVAGVLRGAVTVDAGRTLVQPAWTVPFTRRLGLERLRELSARRAAGHARDHLGGAPEAVVYTQPRGVLAAYPGARRVLLVKDDYVAGAQLIGQDARALERDLRRAVTAADAVVVVSPVLRDRLRRLGVEAEVIPAGCTVTPDVGHSRAESATRPRAVYLGGIGPRIRPEHLEAVVDAGCDLAVVGGLQRTFPDGSGRRAVERLLEDPRVHWTGPVGPQGVAQALSAADVGLVPYEASDFNLASFPLKILEYLAAGLPVVSTPLPAVDWIGTGLIRVEESAESFGTAAAEVARTVDAEVRQSCRTTAAAHTWDRRATDWLGVLGLSPAMVDAR